MDISAEAAVQSLAALAQESRLAIYRILVQAGPAGMVAGQIGECLGIPAATLSFHLKTLAHSGLVTYRAEGRYVRYSADFAAMQALIDYLSANCCGADRGTRLPCEPMSAKGGAEEMGARDGMAGRVHRSDRRLTSA